MKEIEKRQNKNNNNNNNNNTKTTTTTATLVLLPVNRELSNETVSFAYLVLKFAAFKSSDISFTKKLRAVELVAVLKYRKLIFP